MAKAIITPDLFSELKLALTQQRKTINYYTQVDICEKFGISRMTLNRVDRAKTFKQYQLARRKK